LPLKQKMSASTSLDSGRSITSSAHFTIAKWIPSQQDSPHFAAGHTYSEQFRRQRRKGRIRHTLNPRMFLRNRVRQRLL
jgi:hypothetical protein